MYEETEEVDLKDSSPTLLEMTREQWGWLAMAAGAVGTMGVLLHRDRSSLEWLLPLGLLGGGAAMLLLEREKGIDHAEERIVAELSNLDPLARAQVMKRVASAELKGPRHDEAAESKD